MIENSKTFWTDGTKVLSKAKLYAYENAMCTLRKFYYNFFEGRDDFADGYTFDEMSSYLQCVFDDFKIFETICQLHAKFEDIAQVEQKDLEKDV